MGADIYFFERGQTEIRDEQITGFRTTDKYYRDPYNNSSTARKLGFSWWRDVGALIDLCGEWKDDDFVPKIPRPSDVHGNLWGTPLVEFRNIVRYGIENVLDQSLTDTWEEHSEAIKKEGYTKKEFFNVFKSDANRLLTMIQKAVDEGCSLYCSI